MLERESVSVWEGERMCERGQARKKKTADCEIDDWDWHDGHRLKFHLYMLIRLHRCITLQEKKRLVNGCLKNTTTAAHEITLY